MKTIIIGPVTAQDLEDADLVAGIVPTSLFIDNETDPPAGVNLPIDVHTLSTMMDHAIARRQADMVLVTYGDALVIRGHNPEMVATARRMRMPVYEA